MASGPGTVMLAALNRFVVALAITVIKAQPDGQSIQEHIANTHRLCLQGEFQHTTDNQAASEDLKRLYCTITTLESQLHARTIEISALKQRQTHLEELLELSSNDALITYARSFTPFDADHGDKGAESVWFKSIASSARKHYRIILQSTLDMQYMLQRDEAIDPPQLVQNLLRACPAILNLIRPLLSSDSDRTPHDDLQKTMTACARAITMLLKACRVLRIHNTLPRDNRQISFVVIDFFRDLLNLLDYTPQTKPDQQECTRLPVSRPSTRASTRVEEQLKRQQAKEEGSAMLVMFMVHILQALDSANIIHRTIFEGCLVCIMSCVGKGLFQAAFGHAKGENIEQDIRAAGNIDTTTLTTPGFSPESSNTTALIHILERALSLAPSFIPSCADDTTSPAAHNATLGASAASVVDAVKQRLQSILVNSIFDTDPGACIAEPSQHLEPAVLPSADGVSADQWLQQEVWRIIGWDILAQ